MTTFAYGSTFYLFYDFNPSNQGVASSPQASTVPSREHPYSHKGCRVGSLLVISEGESVRPGLLVQVHQHPLLQLVLAKQTDILKTHQNLVGK